MEMQKSSEVGSRASGLPLKWSIFRLSMGIGGAAGCVVLGRNWIPEPKHVSLDTSLWNHALLSVLQFAHL